MVGDEWPNKLPGPNSIFVLRFVDGRPSIVAVRTELPTERRSNTDSVGSAAIPRADAHGTSCPDDLQTVHSGLDMVSERTINALTDWIARATVSCIAELDGFATGLQRDLAAVTIGLSLLWSNDQVEGQINRLE